VRAQAAVALLRLFVGGEEGHLDLLAVQDLRDERSHAHVAGVQREVDRLLAGRLREGSGHEKRHNTSAQHGRQRHQCLGAWSSVQTPCGDLPTRTCRTTWRASVSMTVSFFAQRDVTSR
jgi:hypothetical protein